MERQTNQLLTKIFHASPLLRDYISKTQALEKLTQIIRQYLEPELAKNCSVANLINNVLILSTTSAAWNHRLRFLKPDLLNKLRSLPQYYGVTTIEIIQQQPIAPAKSPVKQLKPISLSKANAKQIISTAEHITDKRLANALIKLARHSNQKAF